jgi:hypothetical protein
MAKKANNYFVRVAKYQKEHPRATREHAMKMVSKEIAGVTKRVKTVGAKKKVTATIKKRVPSAGNRRGNSTGPSTVHTGTLTISGARRKKSAPPLSRGIAISKRIEDLEVLLKNTTGTAAKNHVKRLINGEHDKLDAITKNLKIA